MKTGEIIGSIVETILKLALFIFLAVCIYKGALIAYDYGYRVFTEDPVSVGEGRTISVEITEGMSASDIGKMLQDKGLIRDYKVFWLQELLSENHNDEVPGIYDLSTAMTADEMLDVMSSNGEDSEDADSDESVTAEDTTEGESTDVSSEETSGEEDELYIPEDESGESTETTDGAEQ